MAEFGNGRVTINGFGVSPDKEAGVRGDLTINLTDGYTREELISFLKEQVYWINHIITTRFKKFYVEFKLPDHEVLSITFQMGAELNRKNIELSRDHISSPEAIKVKGFAEEIHRTFFSQN